ncbi:MAG: 2-dehydro-3-deoxygalactonokinase [Hyphomicrobiaceae bacterium]|nr:2-dehydro-3-deoxygalactonokinase [Hyphomicrobiaceae bacterium]
MTRESAWVAVDWGTSNLRVWGIGMGGQVLFARASAQGMGTLAPDAYPQVLADILAPDIDPGKPIDALICGMAGARQGWMEAPYLDAPADLDTLAAAAVTASGPDARLRARILPGVCQRVGGAEDVMRGEETQLLGLGSIAPDFSGIVCMPGTHCKWVVLSGRRVERFATVMTGELFEVLRAHSVLRHACTGSGQGPDHAEGVESGLVAGVEAPQRLPSLLFKVRAGALLSARTPDWCAGYLSGLLIGAEIGAQREWIGRGDLAIVGRAGLAELYAQAMAKVGKQAFIVDGDAASLAGLLAARQQGRE